MVNYYEHRKRAIQDIDDMLAKGEILQQIVYKITKNYGFSANIVLERQKQAADLAALRVSK